MPTNYLYVHLCPGGFSESGYAYGQVEGSTTRRGKVKVKFVLSGWWAEAEGERAELSHEDVADREVTEAEALNGVGTFVGRTICTSRVPPGKARPWYYSAVVGCQWDGQKQQGALDVDFGEDTASVVYDPTVVQDLAVETYALRPCALCSVSTVMPREMKKNHQRVYDKFNGVNQRAVRDSRLVLVNLRAKHLDESLVVPLLDIARSEVSHVSIRHILDHVYYKEGGVHHRPGSCWVTQYLKARQV